MLNNDLGIDLGTANTLVYKRDKGIVLREPSVVALDIRNGKIIRVGNDAREMIGRTPVNIIAKRPLKEGVIADYYATSEMLNFFVKKVVGSNPLNRTRVVICVPSEITAVEKRAVEEAVIQCGAKAAYLLEEPLAAAIGAGLPVFKPCGSMIVDIGGGSTEIAVLSLGNIVCSKSIRVAGDKFQETIATFIKKSYNVLIGERTAEKIIFTIGYAYPINENAFMSVRGRDILTGLPSNIKLTAKNVRQALLEPLSFIIEGIKNILEITPPELSSDIMERGITISGGGALLRGIDKLIEQNTGIKTIIAENPLDCVALGTGKMFDNVIFNKVIRR